MSKFDPTDCFQSGYFWTCSERASEQQLIRCRHRLDLFIYRRGGCARGQGGGGGGMLGWEASRSHQMAARFFFFCFGVGAVAPVQHAVRPHCSVLLHKLPIDVSMPLTGNGARGWFATSGARSREPSDCGGQRFSSGRACGPAGEILSEWPAKIILLVA